MADLPSPAATPGWWHAAPAALLRELDARPQGLSGVEAAARLAAHGANTLAAASRWRRLWRGARRLANPLVLVLLAAAAISLLTGQGTSAGIILAMVLLGLVLDQWQHQRAEQAFARLASHGTPTVRVLRDGAEQEQAAGLLVPGDVVHLAAGSLVPADGVLLAAQDLYVQQSALTGEAFPVERRVSSGAAPADEEGEPQAVLFMGTSIVSGTATLLVCRTGMRTRLGGMARLVQADRRELALENDLRRFGSLILRIAVVLVLLVLLAGGLTGRPWFESFLFALALAVGITPELLPMVVTASLARGAIRLSQQGVIVRNRAAIHNLGSMDVLCTDKTGTLTESSIRLAGHVGIDGEASAWVLENGWLNCRFESGIRTPLEDAVLAVPGGDATPWRKAGELPFDFGRRRVSVLLERPGERRLCLKGALADVLALCVSWQSGEGPAALDDEVRARAAATLARLESQGLRVLGVATRELPASTQGVAAADEAGLVLAGFLAFVDPPRPDAAAALARLHALGVRVQVLTGDSDRVTRHLCATLGLRCRTVLLGADVDRLDDRALASKAARCDAFCRVDPVQKLRVIRALRAAGHVVGYIGDGINDAPALHESDVGITVDTAAEAAREGADLVLSQHGLAVLDSAVTEGRRTFANTRKYILLGTSSNFGNMASMAVAAVALPFLPMLPVQVLLANLLYDGVSSALPLDTVEARDLARPQRWDVALLRRFMLAIGPVSSLFDLLTFAVLLLVLHAGPAQFRSAWFVESMVTQVLAMFVIRTRGPAWRGRPHPALVAAAAAVLALAVALPWTPAAGLFELEPLPSGWYLALAGLTALYLAVLEGAKRAFWAHSRRRAMPRPPG